MKISPAPRDAASAAQSPANRPVGRPAAVSDNFIASIASASGVDRNDNRLFAISIGRVGDEAGVSTAAVLITIRSAPASR